MRDSPTRFSMLNIIQNPPRNDGVSAAEGRRRVEGRNMNNLVDSLTETYFYTWFGVGQFFASEKLRLPNRIVYRSHVLQYAGQVFWSGKGDWGGG